MKERIKGKRVRNLHEIIDYHIKSKRYVGGMGRLKKDGRIVKLNGQIFARKTGRDGNEYILIDNFLGKRRGKGKKRWQMVLLKNLISFNENGWSHMRRSAV